MSFAIKLVPAALGFRHFAPSKKPFMTPLETAKP